MKNTLLILTALFFSHLSLAQQLEQEQTCDRNNGSALATAYCLDLDIQRADQRLNKTYQAAIKRIKPEEQAMGRDLENKFRISQRAWLKYRDSKCTFDGDSTGAAGVWSSVWIEACRLDMTNKRIDYFKELFLE